MLMFEDMLKVYSGQAAIFSNLSFTFSLTMCISAAMVSKACVGRSTEAAKDDNYI